MPTCIQCRESYVKAKVPPNGRRLLTGFCGIACQIVLEKQHGPKFPSIWMSLAITLPGVTRPDLSDVLAVDAEYQALDAETKRLGQAYFVSLELRRAYQRQIREKLGL
jgi:hypothetical protein